MGSKNGEKNEKEESIPALLAEVNETEASITISRVITRTSLLTYLTPSNDEREIPFCLADFSCLWLCEYKNKLTFTAGVAVRKDHWDSQGFSEKFLSNFVNFRGRHPRRSTLSTNFQIYK